MNEAIEAIKPLVAVFDRLGIAYRVVEVGGINHITPEDTILRKLEWFLLSGGSERQWRDVIGVLQIQANALDWDYLRHWAKALALTDALEGVVEAAKKDTA